MSNYQNLRLQNIFNPQQSIQPNASIPNVFQAPTLQAPPPTIPQPQTGGLNDIASRMAQLYQPETAATDRYNQLIGQYPQDTGHGKLARIGAALLGAGATYATDGNIQTGYNLGKGVLDYKRNRQLEDWQNQIKPASDAANLERQSNVNERNLANNVATQELNSRRQDETERNNRVKNDIAQYRAEAYRFKQMNPDWKANFDGPTLVFTNNKGEYIDTKYPTANMSDMEKLEFQRGTQLQVQGLRNEGALDRTVATQDAQSDRQEQGAWQPYDRNVNGQTTSGRFNRITGQWEPLEDGGNLTKIGTPGSDNPRNQAIATYSTAMRVKNTDPELGKFIRMIGQNEFQILTPGMPGGPTPEQHQRLSQMIYGNNGGQAPASGNTPPKLRPQDPAPGYTYIWNPETRRWKLTMKPQAAHGAQ